MTTITRQRARDLRQAMTDAERRLWQALRRRQLDGARFRRQYPIGNYIVDFVCLERKLIIEVDGGQHLDNDYDQQRDRWLNHQAFRVLRFWNHDVLKRNTEVLEHILRALQESAR